METRPETESGPLALSELLREEGIHDERILAAFRNIDRALFVPPEYQMLAYHDVPIAIGRNQVTTQPSLIAHMLEGLRLQGSERVLEIGTGWGFQTALLATLGREVVSIERFASLASEARRNLLRAGIENALVLVGDGTLGAPERAPYDAIIVSAAAPEVPPPLVEQLAEGGRLVQPIGPGGDELVFAFHKHAGQLHRRSQLTRAYFVPLLGRYGVG